MVILSQTLGDDCHPAERHNSSGIRNPYRKGVASDVETRSGFVYLVVDKTNEITSGIDIGGEVNCLFFI